MFIDFTYQILTTLRLNHQHHYFLYHAKNTAQKFCTHKWNLTAKRIATHQNAVLSNRFNVVVRYEHDQ